MYVINPEIIIANYFVEFKEDKELRLSTLVLIKGKVEAKLREKGQWLFISRLIIRCG